MKNNDWSNKKVAILGYGIEGQSSVNYFLRHGALVDVHEHKSLQVLPQDVVNTHQAQGVTFITEQQAFQELSHYDLVMRTPTFSPHHPSLSAVDPDRLSSQTKFFLQMHRDQTIGISGTKGKGTVATLIHHLLQKSGKSVALGGNIGMPLLDIIDSVTPETIAVVELSSFQLWDVNVSPHIAVLLMVVPEHLEQHGTLDDYLQSKQNLLRYQLQGDMSVLLTDYDYTAKLAQSMPGEQWYVSKGNVSRGLVVKDDSIYNKSLQDNPVACLADTVLRGSHNTENLAAALVAASLAGVDITSARNYLSDYRPLPHRLERVGEINQIAFYDDSIATTPEAAIAGIKSFSEPTIVILGGINKQADWRGVIATLADADIRGCVLLGDEAETIRQTMLTSQVNIPLLFRPESLDEAISWSAKQLPKDTPSVVLLSPGAKSFDQFQDYKDRGHKFAQSVKRFSNLSP